MSENLRSNIGMVLAFVAIGIILGVAGYMVASGVDRAPDARLAQHRVVHRCLMLTEGGRTAVWEPRVLPDGARVCDRGDAPP